jgi:hypothetical protein
MQQRYIEGPEVRITAYDKIFVNVEFYEGEVLTELEPRRLFPISGLTKYVTLLDNEGKERAIIRDLNSLMPESRDAVLGCLKEYYMIPRIKRLIKRTEKFSIWMWTVETDRGIYTFEIRNSLTAIKILYDGRILILDANDNRYEIPDLYKLDKRSIRLILPDV